MKRGTLPTVKIPSIYGRAGSNIGILIPDSCFTSVPGDNFTYYSIKPMQLRWV
jgi:hypothetical protein